MKRTYQQMLSQNIPVIFDGATGTQIQGFGLSDSDFGGHPGCNEMLCITRPDVISAIHASYLKAGANVIETNTFGGNRIKLGEYGLADRCIEINKAAATLARKAVDAINDDVSRFVCASIGPTGYLPSSSDINTETISFDTLADVFEEQAAGLIDGGVDLLLLETMQDILEIRAALYGIMRLLRKRNITVPIQVQVSLDTNGRMLLGSDIIAVLGAVAGFNPVAVGFNCNMGPVEMIPHVKMLLEQSPFPVTMLPNAGMPENVNGKAVYAMQPNDFALAIEPMITREGVSITGGCCGTSPEHIRALAQALEGKRVAPRNPAAGTFIATGIGGNNLEHVRRPIIIGERLNTQGSKKTKELLLANNFGELNHIALEQAAKGSTIIDLCVAVNERDDEPGTMSRLVSYLSQRVSIPFCIDSTEYAVFEQALKVSPGSVLINSINYEHNGKKARSILTLARDFGCPVIALTIDDTGMAKTLQQKLDLAQRLRDLAYNEFGLPERFIYIDPLIFTLATGDPETADAAKISIEAVTAIKKAMPDIRTVMGVSNVSFGLKPAARRIVNNLMLHYAVKAGLDAAIFNPLHIDDVSTYDPDIRERAEALLFNRKPDALSAFVEYFERPAEAGASASALQKKDTVALPVETRLANTILLRDARGLQELVNEALKLHTPDAVLNTILLPAMEEVGNKMARGEMILPFVLQAAEVMKDALAVLEPHLAGQNAVKRGKIILATVYGDVHDIGKNLVGSILKNQGFEILDLGKQVALETIINAIKREKPDAVGLSALLVTTSREMQRCVEACSREGITVPIIIGGAAVNKAYAQRIAVLENGNSYAGGVFYAKDAFDAIRVLDSAKKTGAQEAAAVTNNVEVNKIAAQSDEVPEPIEYGEPLVPPFYGTSAVLRWDGKTLLDAIDQDRLFKAFWGGGKLSAEEYTKTKEQEFLPVFAKIYETIINEQLLDARAMYAFFPVYTHNETVCLLDSGNFSTELASFTLPRVARKKNRSLADYLRPEGDLIGVQVVTIGKGISERAAAYLLKEEHYSLGFYLNALGNYLTEQVAERVTVEIRRALMLPPKSGHRLSFGFVGLPGVEAQESLFELLSVEERLDIVLTQGFQMNPEHSTMGIFIHHPNAEYL